MGMLVVAEGVETTEQMDTLRMLGCDVGQGFHWGRAMPSADAAACECGTTECRRPKKDARKFCPNNTKVRIVLPAVAGRDAQGA
jgi:predicted signal transduction protein with EAL and GGDEF domain